MSLITGIPIRDSIHTDFSTGISGWEGYRTELTGEFIRKGVNVSGRYGEFSKDIQEYNRKINTLSGAWSDTGMFLTPYNAGFRYTGTGDFNKWDTYSVDFDGVDDKIVLPTNLSAWTEREQKTLSVWVKNGGNTDETRVFNTPMKPVASTAFALGVGYDTDNSAFYFLRTPAGGVLKADFGDVMDTTSWYHFAIVQDGTVDEAYIYQNGVLKATVSNVGEITVTDTTPAAIGVHWWPSYGNEFNGMVDECAIFNSALSAAQILAIYNGGTPQSLVPYSPLSWWRMGDGTLDDGNVAGNGLIGDQVNPTLGSELVPNGDMELDDNWNDIGSPTTNERSTEKVYSGKYSRKCVADAGSDGLKSDTFSLVAGTVYKVSFYYYLEIAAGPTYRWIMKLKDGDGTDLDPSHNLTVTGAWINVTFYTRATATGSSSSFQVFQSLGGDSTFYLDNVSVKPVNGNAGIMDNMTASDIVADTP